MTYREIFKRYSLQRLQFLCVLGDSAYIFLASQPTALKKTQCRYPFFSVLADSANIFLALSPTAFTNCQRSRRQRFFFLNCFIEVKQSNELFTVTKMDFTSTFSQRFYVRSGDYATTAATTTFFFLKKPLPFIHTFWTV